MANAVLLVGPAAAIPLEDYDLAPAPPEFEKLLTQNNSIIDAQDKVLAPHYNELLALPTDALRDIDAQADVIAAMQTEAAAIGVLEETGVLGDVIHEAGLLDGSGDALTPNPELRRLNINDVAVKIDIPHVIAPPAPAAGVVFTQPVNKQPIG